MKRTVEMLVGMMSGSGSWGVRTSSWHAFVGLMSWGVRTVARCLELK